MARTNTSSRCVDFRETGEVVSKVGFKMFLNITPIVVHHALPAVGSETQGHQLSQQASSGPGPSSQAGSEFSLIFEENPLADFVEMPPDAREGGLWWSNVLAGVIRGALEMVSADWSIAGGAPWTGARTDDVFGATLIHLTGPDANDCKLCFGRPPRRRNHRAQGQTSQIYRRGGPTG